MLPCAILAVTGKGAKMTQLRLLSSTHLPWASLCPPLVAHHTRRAALVLTTVLWPQAWRMGVNVLRPS